MALDVGGIKEIQTPPEVGVGASPREANALEVGGISEIPVPVDPEAPESS